MKITDTRASQNEAPFDPWAAMGRLQSGRRVDTRPGALFLADGGCFLSGISTSGPDGADYPPIERLSDPLTPSERREIADAVIACWERWAETGEP